MKTYFDNEQHICGSEIIHVIRSSEKNEHIFPHPYRLIITIFLSLITIVTLPQDSLQISNITIHDTTFTVGALMEIIEEQTSLSFSYNSGIINKKKIVTVHTEQEPVTDVLERVLNDPSLDFRIIGRHLVIYQPLTALSANPEYRFDSVYFFEIRGRVYDRFSKQPLPFANIFLEGKSIGTIANEDGEFLFKLTSEHLADTLCISYMGYKNITIPVSMRVNTDMRYFMDMNIISIQEVIIRLQSPVNILQSALQGIHIYYPQKPVLLTSFYRETVKKGNQYMIVSEALLETYKRGYNDFLLEDLVKIIKGRKRQNINPNDTVILKLKAGLNTMLLLDVVKYTPDFMNERNYYYYSMADIVMDNGRENYAIDFIPKEYVSDVYYKGRIYIDVRDLAITRVEFAIEPSRLDEATHLFVLKKPSDLKVKVLDAKYNIAYRKIGGKYYLHNIHCETGFRIWLKKQLFGSVYTTSVEMVVNQIDTTDVDRFRYRETARTTDVFNDQISEYDETFWGEYNFIRPEDPLEKAVRKLEEATFDLSDE